MSKLNYFSSNKSIVALIVTSILALVIFSFKSSSFILSTSKIWNDAKINIMKPRKDLDAFIKERDSFKQQIVQNIQYKLSSNYIHFPRCEAINQISQNCSDSIFIKIKNRQISLDSNEWVFANIFSYPKTQLSNSLLIDVGKNDFVKYDNRRFIVIDVHGNLVGRIIDLGESSSAVQLINDVKNEIMVENYDNTLQSVLMVPISHRKSELYGITNQDILSVGDTLYTSTSSAVYIPRIPVCKVIDINQKKSKDPFKKVIVESLSDLSRINFGIVIASDIILNNESTDD